MGWGGVGLGISCKGSPKMQTFIIDDVLIFMFIFEG